MTQQNFEQCVSAAKEFGLEIDSRLVQKRKNGLLGIYATEAIPKGTQLCAFPLSGTVPPLEEQDYGERAPDQLAAMHAMAREIAQGAQGESRNQPHFNFFETIDELKAQSVYFFSEQEMAQLGELNPLLQRTAMEVHYSFHQKVELIRQAEPELDEEAIIVAVLNFGSRAWHYGILPVMDLFNHSNRDGQTISELDDGNKVAHIAGRDYAAGEEVHISYSVKDMYLFSLMYNFFDPQDAHFIDYAERIIQTVPNAFFARLIEKLSKTFAMTTYQANGQTKLKIIERGLFFTEQGPTEKLRSLLSALATQNEAELQSGQTQPIACAKVFQYTLESLWKANRVELVAIESLPEKLHRFHHLLTKERQLLAANVEWAKQYYANV